MTLLTPNKIKGMALGIDGMHWSRASWWYVLDAKGEVLALIDWRGLGLGGACVLEVPGRPSGEIGGYLARLDCVRPFKYECQRHKRSL